MEKLYKNIGYKIKVLAFCSFLIEAISSAILGLYFMFRGYNPENDVLTGLAFLILGPIVAWVGSWLLYGFGTLVENSQMIADSAVSDGKKPIIGSVSPLSDHKKAENKQNPKTAPGKQFHTSNGDNRSQKVEDRQAPKRNAPTLQSPGAILSQENENVAFYEAPCPHCGTILSISEQIKPEQEAESCPFCDGELSVEWLTATRSQDPAFRENLYS